MQERIKAATALIPKNATPEAVKSILGNTDGGSWGNLYFLEYPATNGFLGVEFEDVGYTNGFSNCRFRSVCYMLTNLNGYVIDVGTNR